MKKANGLTLAALTPDPANRRAHNNRNLALIAEALKEVGAARSIVVDEANTILAGNGVVQAARDVGLTKLRVVEAAGDEVIAVRRVGLTDAQKRALALYDNRTAELATWNIEQLLADQQTGLDLGTFWTDEELAALLNANGAPKAGLTDPDAVPEVRATEIQRGDLFELGAHRLLCGDSTVAADVARVMGEEKAVIVSTDPPYLVDYTGADRPNDSGKDWTGTYHEIDIRDAETFFRSTVMHAIAHACPNAAFYLWHAHRRASLIERIWAQFKIAVHQQIIWVKPSALHGYSFYPWQHEPCYFGWQKGHKPHHDGDNSHAITSVWACDWEGAKRIVGNEHPTQKPVELFRRPILKHTRSKDVCYEPFSGSGSQVVAAEQTERQCRAIEIEPQYCQVTIDRWEQFTGERATKVGEAVRDRPVTRSKVTRARKETAETEPPARRGRRPARARQ